MNWNAIQHITLFLTLTLLLVTGCDKLEDLIKIPLENNTEVTIPANTVVELPVDILSPDSETNIEQELQNNDSRKDKIKTIYLEELDISTVSPQGKSLKFIKDIQLFIDVDDQPEKEVAWKYDIPDNVGTEIELNTSDDDLAEYIRKDEITIRAKVTTDEVLTQNVTVNIYSRYQITADIL